jgi:MbtH protein
MAIDQDEDARTYIVVVNGEGQYSIWLAEREIPAGWRAEAGGAGAGATGPASGTKAECLALVKNLWTDMRPLSLRSHEKPISG